jgi:hypothetical protein
MQHIRNTETFRSGNKKSGMTKMFKYQKDLQITHCALGYTVSPFSNLYFPVSYTSEPNTSI